MIAATVCYDASQTPSNLPSVTPLPSHFRNSWSRRSRSRMVAF